MKLIETILVVCGTKRRSSLMRNAGIKLGGNVLVLSLFVLAFMIGCSHFFMVSWTALDQDTVPKGTNEPVAFVDINVVPMNGELVLTGQTVLVRDGRIQTMGPSEDVVVPPDALEVAGTGKFLIPGLSDMHMHLFGSENDLMLYLANGVTTIRDLGDGPPAQLEWRNQINIGTRPGPNLLVWSPMFETMKGLESMVSAIESPGGKVNANNPEKMEGLVAEIAAQGYDGIKSHVVYETEIFVAILESSKRHGLRFDGHAPIEKIFCDDSPGCWASFRSMGVEAVPHVEELVKIVDWSEDSIRQAAQDASDDGLWVTSTIALMRTINNQISDYEGELAKVPESQYVNSGVFGFRWAPSKFNLRIIGPICQSISPPTKRC